MQLNEQYWNGRYLNNDIAWDTGQITPPLQEYFNQLTNTDISILIPGCGNCYEAAYLLELGFKNITLVDISKVLCDALKSKWTDYLNSNFKIICADFFSLTGKYDLIVEQTFFCAIDPAQRTNYVNCMQTLLKPGGKLVGLLFNRSFTAGPPFGGSTANYRALFQPAFFINKMEPCYNSILPRQGAELFINLSVVKNETCKGIGSAAK